MNKKLLKIYEKQIKEIYGEDVFEKIKNSNEYSFCYVGIKPIFANNKKSEVPYVRGRIGALDLQILDASYVQYDEEHGAKHYAPHKEKPFFPYLIDYITSDVVYGMVVFGRFAVEKIDANKKDIRNHILDLYPELKDEERKTKNAIHATDTETDPYDEIKIYIDLKELQKENNSSID